MGILSNFGSSQESLYKIGQEYLELLVFLCDITFKFIMKLKDIFL